MSLRILILSSFPLAVEDYAPAVAFDVVISRAFSDLAAFAQTSARHLSPGGRLFAMKGVHPDEEIAQLPESVRVIATSALVVPGLDAQRHLVVMAPLAAAEGDA